MSDNIYWSRDMSGQYYVCTICGVDIKYDQKEKHTRYHKSEWYPGEIHPAFETRELTGLEIRELTNDERVERIHQLLSPTTFPYAQAMKLIQIISRNTSD